MKIRYTFRVEGTFRLSRVRPIAAGSGVLTVLLTKSKRVIAFSITYQAADLPEVPQVKKSETAGIALEVVVPDTPYWDEAVEQAQKIQAHLCLFGVNAVHTDLPRVDWIPESDFEKGSLQLTSIGATPGVPDEAHPLWRTAMLQAAVRMENPSQAFQSQLAFFRAGWSALRKFRYAEAYLFFYYFLEGLFGGSEIKSKSLARAMLISAELTSAVERVVAGRTSAHKPNGWGGLSAEQAINKLIGIRGFFSHNPSQRAEQWRPDGQGVHAVDATFIAQVANEIVLLRIWAGKMPAFASIMDRDQLMYSQFLDGEK